MGRVHRARRTTLVWNHPVDGLVRDARDLEADELIVPLAKMRVRWSTGNYEVVVMLRSDGAFVFDEVKFFEAARYATNYEPLNEL